MKDSEIIDLYWKRSESAISATAEQYGAYCYSISYRIINNHEEAEECVNDTYLKAWQTIPPQRPKLLSAYLGRITRNLSLNRLRRFAAEKRGGGETALVLAELEDCLPSGICVEQAVEEKILVEAINRFLYAQPKMRRNIFLCRYWYLVPVKEIAQKCGLKEGYVAVLLHRMRKELKTCLEKEGIVL